MPTSDTMMSVYLRAEARTAAERRGHTLGKYRKNGKWWDATCSTCGMGVQTTTKPAPNETDIAGEAVALNCKPRKNPRTEVLAPNGAWLALPPKLARVTETQLRKWLNARGLIGVKEGNRVWILGNDNAVKKAERLFIGVGGTKKNPPTMTCDVCGTKAEAKDHPCRFENGCTCWRGVPCRKKVTGLRVLRDNPRKNVEQVFAAWEKGKSKMSAQSIWTNGQTIFSYRTWLLHRKSDGSLILNETKYSHTTSTQQSGLRYLLRGLSYDTVTGVRQGSSYDEIVRSNPKRKRRVRKNPPLVTFGNPNECMSDNVVEIRYQHNEDGQYYKHKFKRGQVRLHASAGTKAAVLKRVDGKPLISDY